MLIVHVEHVATPHPGVGNRPGDAWCERPGGPARKRRGRSSREAERVQEPEGDRMTAATKYGSPRKLPCGDRSARRTRFPWVRPVSSVKEWTSAAEERGGVWVRAPAQGS